MSLQMAFGITAEDVENVLRENAVRVTNTGGHDFASLADSIFCAFGNADLNRIAKAALDSEDGMDDQTKGAYDEIRIILVELGILKF